MDNYFVRQLWIKKTSLSCDEHLVGLVILNSRVKFPIIPPEKCFEVDCLERVHSTSWGNLVPNWSSGSDKGIRYYRSTYIDWKELNTNHILVRNLLVCCISLFDPYASNRKSKYIFIYLLFIFNTDKWNEISREYVSKKYGRV